MNAPDAALEHPLTTTYRAQLNAGFTFADARAIIPYLRDLGSRPSGMSEACQRSTAATAD